MMQERSWRLPPQNGVAIRVMRERTGMNRKGFAERLGMSESHFRNIENEIKSARRETIALAADLLGVPVGAITRFPPSHAVLFDPPPQEGLDGTDA